MTGFAGRVSFEGNAAYSESLIKMAIRHANKLSAWKQTQGMSSVTKAFDLGDGNYAIVIDLEHLKAIHVVAPATHEYVNGPAPNLPIFDDYDGVMDVHSGVVTGNSIVKEKMKNPAYKGPGGMSSGIEEEIEVDVLKAFTPTTSTAKRFTDFERRRRLAVEEDQMFRSSSGLVNVVYSEHAHVVPSMYSGSMRKVAQLLLGMGKAIRPTYEEKWMEKNKESFLPLYHKHHKTKELLPDIRSSFALYKDYDPTKPVEVKFRFDYRVFRSTGISFDKDGVAWVVEIGDRGVLAMRLYLDPISTSESGRQRYIDTQPELEEFIKEFGGIPTGTPFPVGSNFQKWIDAGEVVRLMTREEMFRFTLKQPYSSAVNWAFNNKGSVAHNTCYSYDDDGLIRGYHYKVDINIIGEKLEPLGGARAQLMALMPTYIDARKCLRMSERAAKKVMKLVTDRDMEGARDAFDAVKIEPTIKGTASLSMLRFGTLYHPGTPAVHPQIKFPEPLMHGLLSFDFTPALKNVAAERCDMVMFVCYIDNSLESVSYSYDTRRRKPIPAEDSRAYCQFTGSWETYTPVGAPVLYGNFYSTRFDYREEIPTGSETRTTYTGSKGPTQGWASVIEFFASCITVVSFTNFIIRSKSSTMTWRHIKDSVAIPMQNRNAYYFAKYQFISDTSASESLGIETAHGPQVQLWQLYNFVYHWRNGCGPVGKGDQGTITCIAKKRDDFTVDSCISDVIPGTIYYSVCPGAVYHGTVITVTAPLWDNGILGNIKFPKDVGLPTEHSKSLPGKGTEVSYEICMVVDDFGTVITEKGLESGKRPDGSGTRNVDFNDLKMSNWWFEPSPSPSGAVPWMGNTPSCLGAQVVNYHPDLDGAETKHLGTPTMFASPYACFTGVTE